MPQQSFSALNCHSLHFFLFLSLILFIVFYIHSSCLTDSCLLLSFQQVKVTSPPAPGTALSAVLHFISLPRDFFVRLYICLLFSLFFPHFLWKFGAAFNSQCSCSQDTLNGSLSSVSIYKKTQLVFAWIDLLDHAALNNQ